MNQIPHSIADEAAVIGSMLLDSSVIPEVLDRVSSEDIFNFELKSIFQAVDEVWREKSVVDAVLVRGWLVDKNKMDDGMMKMLAKVFDSVPSSANAVYYADRVLRLSMERKLIVSVDKLAQDVYNKALSIEEKQQVLTQAALQLNLEKKGDVHISEVAIETLDSFFKETNEMSTGFKNIDFFTGGFAPSQMVIIAGRPSIGKSALALNMVVEIAKKGNTVGVLSLEMSAQGLIARLFSQLAKIELSRIQKRDLNENEKVRLSDAMQEMIKWPIYFNENTLFTITSVVTSILSMKARFDIKCVFIDYLQLIYASSKARSENRQQEITKICAQLNNVAKQTNIPVIVLSQLNRACVDREDHRPRMSDLRESGAIEQTADLVLFLHRDDYYRKDGSDMDNGAQVIIAKNRQGPTGQAELVWLAENFTFADKLLGE